jgi:biopolymer transport protein TolR
MAGKTLDQDGGGDYAPLAEINVTPMVDVMLVLLIIFMVAAPLMMVGVPVELPRTAAAKVGQTRKPLVVSIDREGHIFVREEAVADEALLDKLTALAAEDKDAVVYVRGDKAIPYGRVMEIMGRVGQAGFHKVSLIAEAPRGTPPAK